MMLSEYFSAALFLGSDKLTICFGLVVSDGKVIGHRRSIGPLKILWCAFHSVQRYKAHLHLAFVRFAQKGHHTHTFSSSEKMYDAVVLQIAHRVVRQDISAQVHHWDVQCIYAALCVWFDQYISNMKACHREGPERSTDDLTKLTHRTDLTASRGRMRDSKHSKTSAQVSQVAGFSAGVGFSRYFLTRPSLKSEGRWTLVAESIHSLAAVQNQNWCALKDNVRIGPVLDTKTTATFFCCLDIIETEPPKLFLGTHQQRFGSVCLSDTRFGATRC